MDQLQDTDFVQKFAEAQPLPLTSVERLSYWASLSSASNFAMCRLISFRKLAMLPIRPELIDRRSERSSRRVHLQGRKSRVAHGRTVRRWLRRPTRSPRAPLCKNWEMHGNFRAMVFEMEEDLL